MSVLLILIIVHETSDVLTVLGVSFVNVLMAIDWWMELVKVLDMYVVAIPRTKLYYMFNREP